MKASVYVRPNKPLTCKAFDFKIENPFIESNVIKPKLIAVDSSTQCHTTPDDVALYMAECLEYEAGQGVCEPHAGSGQLLWALLEQGIPAHKISAFELNYSLCEFTANRLNNLHIEQGDFLNVASTFDRIICNPPFGPVIKHMDHVYSCLKTNGVAICLVPRTYKKIKHEILDTLPDDTFQHCKVSTKIIRIEKG